MSDQDPEAASAVAPELEEGQPEQQECKCTSHLEGAAAFQQPPDCELEVEGVVFPVHYAIVCNASTLLDCLLASFLPTEEEEGEEALEAASDSSVDQASTLLPRMVLKRAGPAAAGEPKSPLTPGKLEAFLHHIYGVSKIKAEGVDDLLQMVDYLQASGVKSACDRELEASAKGPCMQGKVPHRVMELAARHKLPRTMAACLAGTVVMISQGGQHGDASYSRPQGSSSSGAAWATAYLDLISKDLKFQLLRATAHAAYQYPYSFQSYSEILKLADGISELLEAMLPSWRQPTVTTSNPIGYRLTIAGIGKHGAKQPRTIPNQGVYLQGKSDLFISRADLEIELDGVCFPVHSAIVARFSTALAALLADCKPITPGKRLRILLDVPTVFKAKAASQAAGSAAAQGTPAGAAGELPLAALVAAGAHAGVPAAAGPAVVQPAPPAPPAMPGAAQAALVPPAPAPAQPAAGGAAALTIGPITPDKLLCFLRHCYCPGRSIEPEALTLLQVSDVFGTAKMRESAAQALTEKLERECNAGQQPMQILGYLALASHYKLRRMMGLCAAMLVQYLTQHRDEESAASMFAHFQPIAECLNPVVYALACKLKGSIHPFKLKLMEDCTAAVNRVWQGQAEQ